MFSRMIKYKVPAFVWTLLVQAMNLGGQLMVDIMIARMLGPAVAGDFIFAFSISGMLSIFMLFGAGEVAIRMYNRKTHAPEAVLTAMIVLWGGGNVVCFALAAILLWVLSLPALATWSVLAAMVVLSINGLSAIFNHVIVSYDASAKDMGAIVLSRVVMLIGVMWMASQEDVMGVWVVYMLCALLQVVYRAAVVHRHLFALRVYWDGEVFRQVWSQGSQLGVSSIFGTISTRADMPILRSMAGNTVTGLYGAAYRIVSGVTMLSGSLAFALFPYLNRPERARYRWHRRLFVGLPVVGVVSMWLVAWLLAEAIMVWCFGEAFRDSGVLLRWLLVAASFQCVQAFLARYVIAQGHERLLPRAQFCAAAVNLTLLVTLVPSQGAMGAVWATVFGDLVNMLVLVFLWGWSCVGTRRAAVIAPAL